MDQFGPSGHTLGNKEESCDLVPKYNKLSLRTLRGHPAKVDPRILRNSCETRPNWTYSYHSARHLVHNFKQGVFNEHV